MGGLGESEELSSASFWDARYAAADSANDQPTHEWLHNFDSLKPWLSKHLFSRYPAEVNPVILHLGCGDSVWAHVSIILMSCHILAARVY
jgi:hypothetical protein